MREGIHPKVVSRGRRHLPVRHTWTVGSTRPEIRTDVCSNCHPFYTGEQRIVDTEGQVDRFMKRLEARDTIATETTTSHLSSELSLSELGLGRQYTELLTANGLNTAGDFIKRLEEGGDDAVLNIQGIGRKVLTDVKKRLRQRGYELPVAQA